MTKIYGIKNCSSVAKALKFFKDNNLEYEYVDFRQTPVDSKKIKEWLKKSDLTTLLNTKGLKYKNLGLKELSLDDNGKIEWLGKENLLIKRPVIEYKNKVVIGFDEENYKNNFL